MRDPLELALAQAARITTADAERLLADKAKPVSVEEAPWLLPHQRTAAGKLRDLVARWRGAVLADATGLGKTYVALAVGQAEASQLTVVAPAALRQQWLDAARRTDVAVEVASTESLSRGRRPPGDAGLVLVDEAHHFRNPSTRRYRILAEWLTGRRVLLLTATPIVNRVNDLVALLRLFLPDDALRAAGVPSLAGLEQHPGLVPTVWRHLSVARDSVEACVEDRLPRRRVAPPIEAPTVSPPALTAILELVDALETPGSDEPRALLKLQLLRSIASSAAAGRASTQHHARFIGRAITAARDGLALPRCVFRELIAGVDPDQLWLLPLRLDAASDGGDLSAWERDQERLRQVDALLDTADDPKAASLQSLLEARSASDRSVIFVGAVATARYLARKLPSAVSLTGRGGWSPAGSLPSSDALRPFAPNARVPRHLDASVLVATDVAGEGLDLHGASLVVHYDLPWTPTRLAQRFGRVRRLGSPHAAVDERAFVPPASLATRLTTVARLLAKDRIGRMANRVAASPGLVFRPHRTAPRSRPILRPPAVVYRLRIGGYWSFGSVERGLPARVVVRRLRALLRAASRTVQPPPSVQLARRAVLHAAGRAARERSTELLRRLERALERLSRGLTAGELLHLDEVVKQPVGKLGRILDWAESVPRRGLEEPTIDLFVVVDDADD